MVMQTRTKFTKQLDSIQDLIARLRDKCVEDVRAAGLAASGDRGAQEGLANGRKAEETLRQAIEGACLDAMLLQQPLIGDDLRFVSGAFRIVSDLSHIDGMTRDLAFLVSEIPDKASGKFTSEFVEMSEHTAIMTQKAVDSFLESDVRAAQEVIEGDEAVNSLYSKTEDKLVALIRDGKSSAKYLPELLMVAKYFERIGDLSKRVSAWAVFRVTGEHKVDEKPSQLGGIDREDMNE